MPLSPSDLTTSVLSRTKAEASSGDLRLMLGDSIPRLAHRDGRHELNISLEPSSRSNRRASSEVRGSRSCGHVH